MFYRLLILTKSGSKNMIKVKSPISLSSLFEMKTILQTLLETLTGCTFFARINLQFTAITSPICLLNYRPSQHTSSQPCLVGRETSEIRSSDISFKTSPA